MRRENSTQWKRVVREVRRQGREANTPCALCQGARGPIDYRTRSEADRDARETGQWWLVGAYRPAALDTDHVVPHAAGGTDTLENAQPTHAECNRQAQAKGTPQQPRTPRQRPVSGYWRPIDGKGESYAGHDIPGRRTASHVFTPA